MHSFFNFVVAFSVRVRVRLSSFFFFSLFSLYSWIKLYRYTKGYCKQSEWVIIRVCTTLFHFICVCVCCTTQSPFKYRLEPDENITKSINHLCDSKNKHLLYFRKYSCWPMSHACAYKLVWKKNNEYFLRQNSNFKTTFYVIFNIRTP